MRIGWPVVAVLALLGTGWFLAHDDGGRYPVPHLFDNMNERPLPDVQQVEAPSTPAGRRVRLVPPSAVAQSAGGHGVEETDDRDAFAWDGSYFSSGRMLGGDEEGLPPELGGQSRSRDALAEGRVLYAAHCSVCHGADGNGKGKMAAYESYPQIGSFRDEKYAAYSPGRLFRSIRLGQGNMPAFGSVLTAREIWCLVAVIRQMQGLTGRTEDGGPEK